MTYRTHSGKKFQQVLEKMGGDKKAKPHSSKEGRIAAGARKLLRIIKKKS